MLVKKMTDGVRFDPEANVRLVYYLWLGLAMALGYLVYCGSLQLFGKPWVAAIVLLVPVSIVSGFRSRFRR